MLPDPLAAMHAAIESGDPVGIARSMLQLDFTLVEDQEEDLGDDKGAMVVEVNGWPAMVAFTSDECASRFVDANPDLLTDEGTAPGFVVTGENLFAYLPDGYGLILNPETVDECQVLPPDLTAQIKRRL